MDFFNRSANISFVSSISLEGRTVLVLNKCFTMFSLSVGMSMNRRMSEFFFYNIDGIFLFSTIQRVRAKKRILFEQ